MGLNYLRDVIGDDANKYTVVGVASSGASGPRVMILEDITSGKLYALKYGDTRVPILQQVKNRQMIEPFFGKNHLPEIFIYGEKVMLMEAIDGQTFHESVVKSTYDFSYLLSVYKKILGKFDEVWVKTAEPFSENVPLVRQPLPRAEKVREVVYRRVFGGQALRGVAENQVIVNGMETHHSLDSLLDLMVDCYVNPTHTILCHGDPNMDNVIINSHMGWWLVDFEWVGRHDWRIPASHFVGWWLSNASFLKGTPQVEVNGTISINYQIGQSELVSALLVEAWKFIGEIGTKFQEEQFEQQIKLQLAILLLGDLRFLEARGRSHYAIPLLGEGLRLLSEVAK